MSISKKDLAKQATVAEKISLNFTTTSADHDLYKNENIQNALLEFYSRSQIDDGIKMVVTVILTSSIATQIKINNQSFYNDFISGVVFDCTNLITSIKIKDTGISGTIEMLLLD